MSDDVYWAKALAEAEAEDATDPLAGFRDRFHLPPGVIYLDGNSLGPAPLAALEALDRASRGEWADGLIGSWNSAGWFELPTRLGDMLAPIVGAEAGEVVVCDTTSLNVFKALHAGLNLRPDRKVIVAEGGGFPTDIYVAEGVLATRPDVTLRLEGVDGPDLLDLVDGDVAVVLVNQVDYRSGRRRDVAGVTARIHAAGAVALWDLCHSAGVMEVGLGEAGADLAVGCTYKYLNGGPGSPAFVYAAARHHESIRQPLSGWWGHAAPFDFSGKFAPAPGIRRFLCGTQPILSMRVLEAGLAMTAEAESAGGPGQERCADRAVHGACRGERRLAGCRGFQSARGGGPWQPGGADPSGRLCGDAGADRPRGDRRFPDARHPAVRLRAALYASRGRGARRADAASDSREPRLGHRALSHAGRGHVTGGSSLRVLASSAGASS